MAGLGDDDEPAGEPLRWSCLNLSSGRWLLKKKSDRAHGIAKTPPRLAEVAERVHLQRRLFRLATRACANQ
jgi:hypothetical protein